MTSNSVYYVQINKLHKKKKIKMLDCFKDIEFACHHALDLVANLILSAEKSKISTYAIK